MSRDFQDDFLTGLRLALEPVANAGRDAQGPLALLRSVGWQIDAIAGFPVTVFADALRDFDTALRTLAARPRPGNLKEVLDTLAAVAALVESLVNIAQTLQGPGFSKPANFEKLGRDLINLFALGVLKLRRPTLYRLGVLLTLITEEPVEAGPDDVDAAAGEFRRLPLILPRLRLDRLGRLLKDPLGHLKAEYGLQEGVKDEATAQQASDKLFPRLAALLQTLSVRAVYGVDPTYPFAFGSEGDRLAARTLTLIAPLPEVIPGQIEIGSAFLLDPEIGLAVRPFGSGEFSQVVGDWELGATLQVAAEGLGIDAAGVTFSGAGADSASATLQARKLPPADGVAPDGAATAALLFGSATGTRLEVGEVGLAVHAGFAQSSRDFGFMLELARSAVVIASGEGDGFLGKILPAESRIDFDFAAGWSNLRGLHIRASGGLELRLPVNLGIGPVTFSAIHLGLRAGTDDGKAELETSASVQALLGPVGVTAERVGLLARFDFTDPDPNLGVFDLDFDFKLPSGVGISINAGPVTGGGFIGFSDGRYAGALELKIYSVSVKAFGVIDTRLPDGSEGFSFVIVISAEFTPIQLGLGFTLLGVGGLLGINRRLDGEALRNAVRDGHLENVLFPTNVAVRAPEIIRDLTALFPPTEGRYVFGPLAKIGWGTPTLIRADLGIVLELPGPILSLLGEVHCQLPTAEAALVSLHLTVAGQLNFPEKSFELFASLRDSQIAGFTVRGQMAMRLRWGERPVFALAVGGFHPAFTPPPRFPALQPMTVDLGRNGNPGIMLTGFFAITSNTAQVGGTLALRASGSGVTLEASLSVKAIFVFSPFSFEAEIDARVRVSFKGYGIGVRLHGTLSGPSPWRVKGAVCVSVLWWDACLRFDKSFGGGRPVQLPEIDPFFGTEKALGAAEDIPGLEDAIKDPRSWEPVVPSGVFAVVSLAQAVDEAPPFDPMGGLSVRQKVVPLETGPLVISRFGVARAALPRAFTRTRATITSGSSPVQLVETGRLRDNFAPGQFFEMDAHHKLSAPSFEEHVAGYSFAVNDNDALSGSVGDKEVTYRTRVVDSRPAPPPPITLDPYPLPEGHLEGMMGRSAAGLFGVGRKGDTRYVDPTRPDRFGFRPPRYLAADKTTLLKQTGVVPATTKLTAMLSFERHLSANPLARDALQVVPEQEALP